MSAPLPHTLLDIQFSGPEQQKLRRLVDEICSLQRSLNAVIAELNTISGSSAVSEMAQHEFLGDRHILTGLTVGQALKAITPTTVGFGAVRFEEMHRADPATFLNAQEGHVLTLYNGFYAMRPLP